MWRTFLSERRHEWRDGRLRPLARELQNDPLTMLVVGARGEPPGYLRYLRRRGCLRLYGVEPEPAEARRLASTGRWDAVIDCALGATAEQRTLYVTRNPGCASALRPNVETLRRFCSFPEWFDVVKEVPMTVRPLPEVLSDRNLPAPDLLQLDVQGMELEVLTGALPLLSQIGVIDLECHFYPIYEQQPLIWDVHRLLDAQGFAPIGIRQASVFAGFLVEAEVAYVNTGRLDVPRTRHAQTLAKIRHRWR